jgi:transposase InsO family protein
VIELRQQHPLEGLLKLAGLARSTFYYQQKVQQSVDKYAVLKTRICAIFDEHKGRYGYRRITAAVRRAGHLVNHKTVQRLMGELQLKSRVRIKKYRAYRGEEGQVFDTVAQTVVTSAGELTVSCSVGVSLCPVHGQSLDTLLKAADQAMYGVKQLGRKGVGMTEFPAT